MNRLTTNKETPQMSMIELSHNSCYIEDKKARYCDYETDIDARELARKLLKDFAQGDDAFTCDDDFDEYIMDCLQYGFDDIEGLIAVFYRNLWAMAELRERLKYYEDLEEQGLLVKLPYSLDVEEIYFADIEHGDIVKLDAYGIEIRKFPDGEIIYTIDYFEFSLDDFGKTVFLTKEEAEEALQQMK